MGQQPMSLEDFRQQAVAGMATGGRVPNIGPSGINSLNGWGDTGGPTDKSYGGGQMSSRDLGETQHRNTQQAKQDRAEYERNRAIREHNQRAADKAKAAREEVVKKPDTLKNKLISGGKTLAELKNARDILTGNWLGVGKNVIGAIGARKLLGDQAYRGGDIKSWSTDQDDVSGLAGIDFSNLIGTTPDTDYTQLAKVTDDQKAIIKRDIGLVPDLFSVQDVYDKAKKLDDTGAFWNPLDKGDPMTKPEFNEYIKTLPGREEKGPFINLKADGGLINFFKNGGFLG